MLRRPQRTEAAQRLEARTARTFEAPLRAGVSSNNGPARSQAEAASAEARARGVPLLSQPQHGERARGGTVRAAQQCTLRARGAGVVPSSSNAALSSAACLTGGRRRQLPERSDRTRRAKARLICLYVARFSNGARPSGLWR